MTGEEKRVIEGLRAKGFAVVVFGPNEISSVLRERLESGLTELGNKMIETLEEPRCHQCGCELHNGYCKDHTCVYSDWPQEVVREDLFCMTKEQVESKYNVQKRG